MQRDGKSKTAGAATVASASNLTLIPAGKCGDNSSELVANHRIEELDRDSLSAFRLDTDRFPAGTGGYRCGRSCPRRRCSFAVARGGSTPFDVAQRAQATFSNSRILGFVLNAVKDAAAERFLLLQLLRWTGSQRQRQALKGAAKSGMIRLFNVYYPTRTLVLLLCEALLVGGSFLLATAYLIGPDTDIALIYENGLLKIAAITVLTLLLSYYFDLYRAATHLRPLGDLLSPAAGSQCSFLFSRRGRLFLSRHGHRSQCSGRRHIHSCHCPRYLAMGI